MTVTLALSACSAEVFESPECRSQDLLYASPDMQTAAVCRVLIGEHDTCSGTLLAPAIVLTAKHCVQRVDTVEPLPASQLRVSFGARADQPDTELGVVEVRAIPGSYGVDVNGQVYGALLGRDLALLMLEAEASTAEPLEVDLTGSVPGVGQTLFALGYGVDEHGREGARARKAVEVRSVEPDSLWVEPGSCSGDSGGPLLDADDRVVAVASATLGECGQNDVMYTRLDAHAEFVRSALDTTEPGREGSCVSAH